MVLSTPRKSCFLSLSKNHKSHVENKSCNIAVVFNAKMNGVIKWNMHFFKIGKIAAVLNVSLSDAKIDVREHTAHKAFGERRKFNKNQVRSPPLKI